MTDLPKFYVTVMVSGGHWVGTGSQPLWPLVAIALASSITLWGIGQLLESLSSIVKRRCAESVSPLTGLENVDFLAEEHLVNMKQVPNCDEIVSSCLENLHH